ncbi:MAG: MFS transporter [Verrucomicrobiaceae bacterium]|nr:MFS transporter [Verrucomicrobiaceae bacterium]
MPRSSLWKWYICGLLLLATTINYMDRQTLSNAAAAVKAEFRLDDLQYGNLETAFGLAFGAGSLVFGFLCERFSLRWMYPVVLGGWSLAGLFSSWAADYHQFMAARIMLGLFEAGHWPCALKTTFRLLQPNERMMGNSVLQSGASIGAIITPKLVLWLSQGHPQGWRFAFQVIALTGVIWIVLWMVSFRLQAATATADGKDDASTPDTGSLMPIITGKKFWAIALLLVGIQIPWQIIRAWLPLFLQSGRGYDPLSTANFVTIYYIATDVGCILAGILSLQLVKRLALSNHAAKRRIFNVAAVLASLTIFIPWLDKSPLLLGLLLVIGAASLAMFPCYYSFVQELSAEHVSRLTGLFSMWVWITTSPLQSLFGWLRVRLGSYDPALALTGLTPWLGVLAMALLWDRAEKSRP